MCPSVVGKKVRKESPIKAAKRPFPDTAAVRCGFRREVRVSRNKLLCYRSQSAQQAGHMAHACLSFPIFHILVYNGIEELRAYQSALSKEQISLQLLSYLRAENCLQTTDSCASITQTTHIRSSAERIEGEDSSHEFEKPTRSNRRREVDILFPQTQAAMMSPLSPPRSAASRSKILACLLTDEMHFDPVSAARGSEGFDLLLRRC